MKTQMIKTVAILLAASFWMLTGCEKDSFVPSTYKDTPGVTETDTSKAYPEVWGAIGSHSPKGYQNFVQPDPD